MCGVRQREVGRRRPTPKLRRSERSRDLSYVRSAYEVDPRLYAELLRARSFAFIRAQEPEQINRTQETGAPEESLENCWSLAVTSFSANGRKGCAGGTELMLEGTSTAEVQTVIVITAAGPPARFPKRGRQTRIHGCGEAAHCERNVQELRRPRQTPCLREIASHLGRENSDGPDSRG